jgi:polyferredoxin
MGCSRIIKLVLKYLRFGLEIFDSTGPRAEGIEMDPRTSLVHRRRSLARRRRLKAWLWPILPVVLGAVWLYPAAGFVMLLCMGAGVGVAFFRGREWCDVCPRGAFYDIVVKRLGVERRIPKLVRTPAFRLLMIAVMMTIMTLGLYRTWGDPAGMGGVFVSILIVTTVVGLAFAAFVNPRAWCSFCPIGSMAFAAGRGRRPMRVDGAACTDCGVCAKVCPMELDPSAYKAEGSMAHGDCIKCLVCVAGCPRGALSLEAAAGSAPPSAGQSERPAATRSAA